VRTLTRDCRVTIVAASISLASVTQALDQLFLDPGVPDYPDAYNGLQLENRGTVTKIAAAVDLSLATARAAAAAEADFLLVHHGLFWGGTRPWVGRTYRRLDVLVRSGIAVYAAHLPLDAHPTIGNNALFLAELGVVPEGRFGRYRDHDIGWWGTAGITREELTARVRRVVNGEVFVMPFGPEVVQRVGVVTGGAGSMIADAHAAGLDAFVTGEGPHHTYFDAQELGITAIYAGHYATETLGIKATADLIASRFGLPWVYIDFPTGL